MLKQLNNSFNNYYPVFFLKNNYIRNFFLKLNSTDDNNYLKFIQLFVLNFFELFFKKKINLKIITNASYIYEYSYYINYILDDFKNYQPKINKYFYVNEMLEIIWYSFYMRDIQLLFNWFIKLMEKTHFKNHKKFLNLFQSIILNYSNAFLEILKIEGFFFDIRGKVGVAGNSKKRHFFFKIGKISLSNKNVKIDHQKNVLKTNVGSLGVTMILSY